MRLAHRLIKPAVLRVTLLFLTAACAPLRIGSESRETPPNIIVLLADDLGIGEVGAWGQTELATPNIDRLARDGMRFTEFRSSAAVCGPARCSFMTGFHNGRCRLDDNDNDYLRPDDIVQGIGKGGMLDCVFRSGTMGGEDLHHGRTFRFLTDVIGRHENTDRPPHPYQGCDADDHRHPGLWPSLQFLRNPADFPNP